MEPDFEQWVYGAIFRVFQLPSAFVHFAKHLLPVGGPNVLFVVSTIHVPQLNLELLLRLRLHLLQLQQPNCQLMHGL